MPHTSIFSADAFIERMQGLILNNDMTSSYKLALLRVIIARAANADRLALDAHGLDIAFDDLARDFLELYWPMRVPYSANGCEQVLVQVAAGNGAKLRIFRLMDDFIEATSSTSGMSFFEASHRLGFERLVQLCKSQVLIKQPLTYIRGAEFLFEQDRKRQCVHLAPEVVQYLGRFYPILMELIESRWQALLYAMRGNQRILGNGSDNTLRDFLFDPDRRDNLSQMQAILKAIEPAPQCFYCGAPLKGRAVHADHFVPYSRYRDTKTLNFVLACERCNCSKSNHLAAADHVAHWIDRNTTHVEQLLDLSHGHFDAGLELTAQRTYAVYEDACRNEQSGWLHAAACSRQPPAMEPIPESIVRTLKAYVLDMRERAHSAPAKTAA